jgi:hypothetical protein
MKRLLIFVFTISLVYLNSCQKDDTTTTSTPGSIIDTWNCTENSPTYGTSTYQVDISKDTSSTNKVIIDDFYHLGLGKEVKATLNNQTLTISNAIIDGFIINGTGTIASNYNTITWNYSVDDGSGSENVTATYTRM